MSTTRDFIAAAKREIEEWPGASATFEQGPRHNLATVEFSGTTKVVTFSISCSDHFGVHNFIGDLKWALKALGAERRIARNPNRKERRAAPKHKPKPPPQRPKREEEPDRWISRLAELKERMINSLNEATTEGVTRHGNGNEDERSGVDQGQGQPHPA